MLKRILITAILLLCIFSLVLQITPFISDGDHHCCGTDCPLCLCISAREAVAALFVLSAFPSLFICVFSSVKKTFYRIHVEMYAILVYLKVKLSN